MTVKTLTTKTATHATTLGRTSEFNPRKPTGAAINKVFLDFGARKGEALEWFVEKRPDLQDARVVFFEPCHEHLDDLRQLQQEQQDRDITIIQKAVWGWDGVSDFRIYEQDDANSLLQNTHTDHLVREIRKVETIDVYKVIEPYKDDYVIVKIDVEGAEVEILERMVSTGACEFVNELLVEYHGFVSHGARKVRKLLRNKEVFKGIYLIWDY